MTSIFQCTGCGIPGIACMFHTTEDRIDAEDIAGMCPKPDHIPVWRELVVKG
jgi:hypothetical protein